MSENDIAESWQSGTLLRRYKRFLADVRLADGSEITIHCPNTGSMKNCVVPDSPCWFSRSSNPKRKYAHTWEVATVPGGHLAGVNTGRANALVERAIRQGVITELQGYRTLRREVRYGQEKSRIDFLLEDEVKEAHEEAGIKQNPGRTGLCYVEVKSVTLMEQPGQGLFPDAVSQRGSKHLRELMEMVRAGHRAVLLFCVQHTGIKWVEPADLIDPFYGETLRRAAEAGVEILAYGANIEPEQAQLVLGHRLPVKF